MKGAGAGGRWALLVAALPFLFGFDLLASKNHDVEQGNTAMKAGKAEDALAAYDKAAAKLAAEPGLHFDRGTALYALSRLDEATQEFLRATEAKDGSLKAAAFYNLGNAYAKSKKFKEAIEAYKRSLALNPRDNQAKANLELAQRQQKEEEKKKQDDKNKDQNKKDDKNKDDKKDQNKKDDQKKDDKKKDDQDKNKNDKKDEKQDQKNDQQKQPNQPQPQPQPAEQKPEQKPPDDKDIGAVLDSLERSPKDLEKERARLRAVRRGPPAKDW
ncbi:MAG TPA: tetratricopeptide repeat protein [Polyangia bacterium]|nr:tetratricopeptide repeat protein [Polyangia bacterium]